MESKKRPYPDEEPSHSSKRHITTSENGSPRINGASIPLNDSPEESLETFRKDAIYRAMKHYSRECERTASRVAELEKRKATCEAGLAAMSACWAQLVETIHAFVRPEDLTESESDRELFDLRPYLHESPAEIHTAITASANATHDLVSKFVRLNGNPDFFRDEVFVAYKRVQSEYLALKTEVDLLRERLRRSEEEAKLYRTQLSDAQKRVDRLSSQAVKDAYKQNRPSGTPPNDDTGMQHNEELPPPDNLDLAPINGHSHTPDVDWKTILESREAEIEARSKELAELHQKLVDTETELETLKQSDGELHRALFTVYKRTEDALQQEKTQHSLTIEQSLATRSQLEEHQLQLDQEINDLKSLLSKRDADLTRLREIRDQQLSELNERKQKDTMKMASLHELKQLVESKSAKEQVMRSQLKRYKLKLATYIDNDDLLKFVVDEEYGEGVTLVDSLRKRLHDTEARASALEAALENFKTTNRDVAQYVEAEAVNLEEIMRMKAELDKHRAIYGDQLTSSPDVASLASRLEEKEQRIRILERLNTQHEEAIASSNSEIDKISAEWEKLDLQVKKKVYDLAALEERLQKALQDRGKSENKFFSAMREKDAVESERKLLVKTNEKQAKVIDELIVTETKLKDLVHTLKETVGNLEATQKAHKSSLMECQNKLLVKEKELHDKDIHENQLKAVVDAKLLSLESQRKDLRSQMDHCKQLEQDLERQKTDAQKLDKARSAKSDTKDDLLKILTCSTCHQRLRDTIINRCNHTFCKDCVDARLQTRQRRCPSCNNPFSQSDVISLIFQ